MKILLILGAMPSTAPYIKYYTDFLDEKKISYKICAWNRYAPVNKSNTDIYVYDSVRGNTMIDKIRGFKNYSDFVIKLLKSHKGEFDRIIVFTIAPAIFLSKFLISNFKNRYIIDIRDYSPLMRFLFFRKRLALLLTNSFANVISSPGFVNWLPKQFNYIISHNTSAESIVNTSFGDTICHKPIRILTIGILRDIESVRRLLSDLSNNKSFFLQFSGKGIANNMIEEYIAVNNVQNVIVTGSYEKKEENSIVAGADMINILMPHNMTNDYLMANRFYHSVIQGKPMIVNSGCIQASFVERFNLGVIIEPSDCIADKILNYWKTFDNIEYNKGRKEFINIVKKDITDFYQHLEAFTNI